MIPVSPARLGVVEGSDDPHELDLADLIPRPGTIDHIWFVPARRGSPQVVVAWQRGTLRGTPRTGYEDTRRYALTLWNPEGKHEVRVRWVPHVLVAASPFPIEDYRGRSAVRLADVTHDDHDDLLVTVGCNGCNHGTSAAFVVATFGRHVRRIYGHGRITDKTGAGVRGRILVESSWGACRGLLWFDTPWRTFFSGWRIHTFARWDGHVWRTVQQSRVRESTPIAC